MSIATAKQHAKQGEYEIAIEILESLYAQEPENVETLFNLASILEDMNREEDALIYYQIHLTIHQTPRVLRAVSKILLHLNQIDETIEIYNTILSMNPSDINTICDKGKLLNEIDKRDEARTCYQKALRLTHHNKDILTARVYHEYGALLLHKYNDIESAALSLANSLKIQENTECREMYQYCIKRQKTEAEAKIKECALDPKRYKDINIIVFDVDDIVLFKHEIDAMDMDSRDKDVMHLFGGRDRIHALRTHLQRLKSMHNMSTALVTAYHENLIKDLLQRTGLSEEFDHIYALHSDWNIVDGNRLSNDNRCYINTNSDHINIIREHCKILYTNSYSGCCVPGLKLIDIQQIEYIFHLKSMHKLYYTLEEFPFELPSSGIMSNNSVYVSIKTEIETMSHSPVEHLNIFQWMQKNLTKYKDCYKEFAMKFGDCFYAIKQREHWVAANFLYQLLQMEGNDSELHGQYATCLGHLGIWEDADAHFIHSLRLKHDSYSVHEAYASHLFNTQRYFEAVEQFNCCIALKKFEGQIKQSRFLVKYAKANDFCGTPETAEIAETYYCFAIQYCNKRNKRQMARCHADFGAFLKKQRRLEASRKEYEIALRLDPNNMYLHWKLSQVLFNMDLKKEHEEHLVRALEINSTFEPARRDYYRYFQKEYGDNDGCEEKGESVDNINCNMIGDIRNLSFDRNNNNDIDAIRTETNETYVSETSTAPSRWHPKNKYQYEFNRQYLNKFGKEHEDKEVFRKYLNEMVFKNLNDIRMVLNNDLDQLRKQIGMQLNIANNTKDLNQLCHFFKEMKHDYGVFIAFCSANDMDKIRTVLEENGIFSVDAIKLIKSQRDLMLMMSHNNAINTDVRSVDAFWSLIKQISRR